MYSCIPTTVGTKNNVIFRSFACESAGAIIICIAISSWTGPLEDSRIIGWLAGIWVGKFSTAAVLIRLECLTSTPTPDHTTLVSISTNYLKFSGATCTVAFFRCIEVLQLFFHVV